MERAPNKKSERKEDIGICDWKSRVGNEVMEVQKLHFTVSPFPTGPQASPAEACVAFLG